MEPLSSPDNQNILVLGNVEHGPTCIELGEAKKWNLPRTTAQTCFKIRADGLGVVGVCFFFEYLLVWELQRLGLDFIV